MQTHNIRYFFVFFALLFSTSWGLQAQTPVRAGKDSVLPDSLQRRAAQADSLLLDGNMFLIPDSLRPDTLPDYTQLPAFDTPKPEAPQQGSAFILDAKVEYSAKDSIIFNMKQQKVYMYGDVKITYQDIYLEAAYVEINFSTNELFAKGLPDSLGQIVGNPMFKELEQSFTSKAMTYNFTTKKGRIIQVITQEADGFLHGAVVKKMEDNIVHICDGKYTTCSLEHPHFEIRFNRAKVYPKDKIITSSAWLVIEGVSTPLILPFGFFPNKRGQANGILMPSYGESSGRGFFLENGGFYWGINEYVDLAIRGDIYSRGSWALKTESQYRRRYKYSGRLSLNYAENIESEKGLPDYSKNKDFRVAWSHTQDPKARPNSSFSASVNAGSSKFNRYNPVSANDYLNNTMQSSISYSTSLFGGKMNMTTSARHNQNTSNHDLSISLPDISLSMNRVYPFRKKIRKGELKWYENIGVTYNSNMRNELNTKDTLLFEPGTLNNMRNGIQHQASMSQSSKILKHFTLTNSINYSEKWYLKTFRQNWFPTGVSSNGKLIGEVRTDTIDGFRAARDASFSTSMNTTIYGMLQFKKGPLKAVRHVVRPSIGFSMRPDYGNPFFNYYGSYYNGALDREMRYSYFTGTMFGGPPDGRSGAINFSLGNNLEMKVRSKKDTLNGERKIVLIESFNISSSYDIARDSLRFSDLSLSGRTRLFNKIDITYASQWTPYQTDTNGFKINRFIWEDGKSRFLKLKNTRWGTNFSYQFKPTTKKGVAGNPGIMNDPSIRGTAEELHSILDNPDAYVDFSIPWNFGFSYTFTYSNDVNQITGEKTSKIIQTLNFNGDVNLTPKWKIGFRSGYDFDNKAITYTSVDIYRDLHCWDLSINWIPFGARKSYMMTLKVKAAVLQDLKLTKRNQFWDYSR